MSRMAIFLFSYSVYQRYKGHHEITNHLLLLVLITINKPLRADAQNIGFNTCVKKID